MCTAKKRFIMQFKLFATRFAAASSLEQSTLTGSAQRKLIINIGNVSTILNKKRKAGWHIYVQSIFNNLFYTGF